MQQHPDVQQYECQNGRSGSRYLVLGFPHTLASLAVRKVELSQLNATRRRSGRPRLPDGTMMPGRPSPLYQLIPALAALPWSRTSYQNQFGRETTCVISKRAQLDQAKVWRSRLGGRGPSALQDATAAQEMRLRLRASRVPPTTRTPPLTRTIRVRMRGRDGTDVFGSVRTMSF